MRHHIDHRKLGRTSPHRRAMLANMAASLIMHNRIETTLPKAKELRRIADKLVTMGKAKSVDARRRAISLIRDKKAVHKLFSELAERFAERNGGYTRIYHLGNRLGDAAPMAAIEYLPADKGSGGATIEHKDVKKKALKKHAKSERKVEVPTAAREIEAKATVRESKMPAKRSSPAHRSGKGE